MLSDQQASRSLSMDDHGSMIEVRCTGSRNAQQSSDGAAKIGNGIEIRESKLPNAGRGAFTTRSFKKGDYITEYGGEVISSDEANLRRIAGKASHIRSLTPMHTAIDGRQVLSSHGEGGASFINDPCGVFQYNCRFVVTRTLRNGVVRDGLSVIERVFARALCDIPAGAELYVNYGAGYDWE